MPNTKLYLTTIGFFLEKFSHFPIVAQYHKILTKNGENQNSNCKKDTAGGLPLDGNCQIHDGFV